jgi:hypothetical protein
MAWDHVFWTKLIVKLGFFEFISGENLEKMQFQLKTIINYGRYERDETPGRLTKRMSSKIPICSKD